MLQISIFTKPAFSAANARSHLPPVASLPKMVLTIAYPIISVCMAQNVQPASSTSRERWSQRWVKPITKSASHVPNVKIHLNLAVR